MGEPYIDRNALRKHFARGAPLIESGDNLARHMFLQRQEWICCRHGLAIVCHLARKSRKRRHQRIFVGEQLVLQS
jgi:hypothetical protein